MKRMHFSKLIRYSLTMALSCVLMLHPAFADTSTLKSGSGTIEEGVLTYTWSSVLSDSGTPSTDNAAAECTGSAVNKVASIELSATPSTFKVGWVSDRNASTNTLTVTITNDSTEILKITNISPAISDISGYGLSYTGLTEGMSLESGASFTIVLTAAPESTGATTTTAKTATVSFSYEVVSNLKLTALPSAYIDYMVNETEVLTSGEGAEISGIVPLSTEITPSYTTEDIPDGYAFVGWRLSDGRLLTGNGSSFTMSEDLSIYPVVMRQADAISNTPYKVGESYFKFWEEAVNAAVKGDNKIIVLVEDHTMPDNLEASAVHPELGGKYTVPGSEYADNVELVLPAGVTFLVPFDDAHTCYTDTPAVEYTSYVTPSPYRTLMIPNGVAINVQNGGGVSVSSKLCATGSNGSSWNGTPYGKHGKIVMNDGSSIVLESGAKLYAYGYIAGDGLVHAKSGSTVYECFQIRCWRGGTATSGGSANLLLGRINSVFSDNRIFPMNQYFIQNVEAALKFDAGASEIMWTGANASSTATPASAPFIGSGGLFIPTSGSITKKYDDTTDRLIIDIDGDATVSSFSLKVATITLDIADFVMPITNNITINVNSGTTLIKQDIALLPGCKIIVDSDAVVDLASGYNLFIYDRDEWGAYAYSGAKFNVVGYSTVNGNTTIRTDADLVDAVVDMNGVFISNGSVYTTNSGASIISSQECGIVKLVNGAGTETVTYQATQSGTTMTAVEIPITSAKLQNVDETYVATASATAGDIYYNVDGYWHYNMDKHDYNENGICTECGLSAVAAIITSGEPIYCSSLAEACEKFGADSTHLYIQMKTGTTETTINVSGKTIYLDLNGQDVTVTNFTVGTLYGMDSTTNAYGLDVPSGQTYTPGTITGTITGAVSSHYSHTLGTGGARHYAAVKSGSTYSFHRFRFGMDSYTYYLNKENEVLAITFSATYLGDANAKSTMSGFGMEINNTDSGYIVKGETGLESVTGENGASGYVLKRTVTDLTSEDTKFSVSALLKLTDNTELESVSHVASVTVSELGG